LDVCELSLLASHLSGEVRGVRLGEYQERKGEQVDG
jgi:hypothetical protein